MTPSLHECEEELILPYDDFPNQESIIINTELLFPKLFCKGNFCIILKMRSFWLYWHMFVQTIVFLLFWINI